MSTRLETGQDIDPLSGVTSRIFVAVVGVVSIATAAVFGFSKSSQISSLSLQICGLAVLLVAYLYFVWAAEPYRRRVGASSYSIVFGLVIIASVLDSLSQLGLNTSVRDDWGPICVALVVMLAGPYRPPGAIIGYTVVALGVTAVTTAIHFATLNARTPITSFTVTGSPVLAVGVAAAIYSGYLVAGLKRDRRHAADERERRDLDDRRHAIEEFLGDDISSLRSEVLPFFRDLKARDALTPADIDRAVELQQQLRASLVATLSAEPLAELVAGLNDPQRLSHRLTERQRAGLRALLVFLGDQDAVGRRALTLSFASDETAVVGQVDALFEPGRGLTSSASPFIGLIQLSFDNVVSEIGDDRLSVSFAL